MKRNLEKALQEKFSGMELLEDPTQWERISREINKRRLRKKYSYLLMAASFCIVMLSIAFILFNSSQTKTQTAQNFIEINKPSDHKNNSEVKSPDPGKLPNEFNHAQKEIGKGSATIKNEERKTTIKKEEFVVMSGGNETKKFFLEDSSSVVLNTGSKLRVASFHSKDRIVHLDGEGFFYVKKQPDTSFKVFVGEMVIEVVGTEFNVKDINGKIQVLVTKGIVKCYLKNNPSSLLVLNQNEMALFNGEVLKKEHADLNTLYWMTNMLVFEQAPLNSVVEVMKENFGSTFSSIDPSLLNCHVTFKVSNPGPEKILNILKSIGTLDYTKNGNDFKLSGKGCK